jgi:hypothetical protein
MNKSKIGAAIAGLALALACGSAAAEVSFDPATGTGFVGKGDVQSAFGWNNAKLQQYASSVTFTVESQGGGWEYECEWWTGPDHNRSRHTVIKTAGMTIGGEIVTDLRVRNQVTGFILNGYTSDFETGDEATPAVGDACIGQGTGAVIIDVWPLAGSGNDAGLFVNFGDAKVPLTF